MPCVSLLLSLLCWAGLAVLADSSAVRPAVCSAAKPSLLPLGETLRTCISAACESTCFISRSTVRRTVQVVDLAVCTAAY